ncbi:hypothetical protein AVDCRST_MAG94-4750, partial [uncultured Leptolyngbya sp.]
TSWLDRYLPDLSDWIVVREGSIEGFPHMLVGYMRVSSSVERTLFTVVLQKFFQTLAVVLQQRYFDTTCSASQIYCNTTANSNKS